MASGGRDPATKTPIEKDVVPDAELAAVFDSVATTTEQPTPPPEEPSPVDTGFVSVETTPAGVTADIKYEYRAPDRTSIHITAGVKDRTRDGDADGLSDAAEAKYGTDPHHYDSDRDGLADGVEVQIGTDPLDKLGDADKDGVPDSTEVGQGMNPHDPDTDHDGISDAEEYDRYPFLATVPTPGSTDEDWDGDGIPNAIEEMYGQSKTIPESQVPEFKAQTDRDYELRQQMNTDPVHQAMVAADLQRQLTPEQQSAFEDAIFDQGIASANVLVRYTFANQLNVIDGTPVPPDLQAAYDQAQADLLKALTERDLDAWRSFNDAVGTPLDAVGVEAFVSPSTDQLLADVNTLVGLGFDPDAIGGTKLGTLAGFGTTVTESPTAAAPSSIDSPTAAPAASNPLGSLLDRMDDAPAASVSDATTGTSPTDAAAGPTGGGDEAAAAPLSAPAADAIDDAPAAAAPALGDIVDGITQVADEIGAQIGTTAGDGTLSAPRFAVDEDAMTGGAIGGVGTTTTGTTEDGRTYTETDLGDAGYKREYDDTGTIQFFDTDGTAKGGELDPHSDAGSGDANPEEGTTDDDGEADPADDDDPDDEPLDDGNSGEGTAYVNPDADIVAAPMHLSPVVAQLVTSGLDPTTTTPSGPYVDDAVEAVLVSSGTATVGLAVPLEPRVVDSNPDAVDSAVLGGALRQFDPTGPDTVDPDDPLIGTGGEDIDAGDLTPPPSAAFGFDDELP